MHVKKNLMLWVAVLALALPLLLVGTASAKYMGDGAVQDGTSGEWITPSDGVCVVGLKANGDLVTDATVTSKRDCIYYTTGLKTLAPVDITSALTGTPGQQAALCTGVSSTTKGTLTWNATDAKCYDSAPCTVMGFASGTYYGSVSFPTSNDGARHALSTSTCEDGSGNGLSLKDLDRTYSMCVAKGGTWKQTSATAPYVGASGTFPTPSYGGTCVAYSWLYRGQNASTGAPLAFGSGTKGTDAIQNAGFCYASMVTGITPSTSCPTVPGASNGSKTASSISAFGYSVSGTGGSATCNYAYGVNGKLAAAMTAANYTTTAAANSVKDLTAYTTYGECLAAGGSWVNWISKGSVITLGTGTYQGMTFDFVRQVVDADEGCLHCHSSVDQANGPVERQKDSYLTTGHKNMLRKVTAGKNWAGPDADGVISVYTSAATGTINFTTAKAMISGTERDLLYLFGDWMAPAPGGLDVIVNNGSNFGKYNGTTDYSCAACHTAGWGNSDPTKGLCNKSQYTSSAACTGGGGVWTPIAGIQSIGTSTYVGAQPADAFPTVTFSGAGQWDQDGIMCSRCHNAAVPTVTAGQISANGNFPNTVALSGGMGNLGPQGPTGVWVTNICFGCHQSMAKTSNGTGLDADLAHPENLIVKNNGTAPAYIPGFSGHVLGNSFLNSPHARFTGTVAPNTLGKYDLVLSTGTPSYSSNFKGYMCWQSASSTSPAKTNLVGGVIHEIKDKTTCENLYGTGAWRPDTQGNCSTCHDVHQSLFVAGQEGLRKECVSCHDDSTYAGLVPSAAQASIINHPATAGTPVGIDPADPCVVCHMPKPTAADFPMHVWRINPDVSYSTFPTYTEFNGVCSLSTYTLSNTCADHSGTWTAATKKNANIAADGTYTNAVWVDLDLACGQCHGGSGGAGAVTNGAPYRTKSELASSAASMHGLKPGASFTATPSTTTSFLVSFDASLSACPTGGCTYGWDFGADSATGTGKTATYTYATTTTTPVAVKLTVTSGLLSSSVTHTVVPYLVNHAPVALGLVSTYPGATLATKVSVTNAAMSVTFTDASTDADNNIKAVTVIWGDGTSDSKTATDLLSSKVFTHSYTKAGTFQVIHTVTDTKGAGNTERAFIAIVPPVVTVSGKITDANTGKNLSGVVVTMTKGTAVRTAKTAFTGSYKFTKTMPGTWTITATKTGYSFTGSPTTITAPTSTIVSAITGSKL